MEFVEITITSLGSEGQGTGTLPSGKTCFVSGVFPGEKCRCKVVSETSKYAVCDAVEVTETSPDRTGPFRPSNEVSGGLPFACLSYEAQLKFKQARVRECLSRIGGIEEAVLEEVFKPVIAFPLSRRIFGGPIRHGMPEIVLVRAFRRGLGRSTGAEMDERFVTTRGTCLRLKGGFVDDSLLPLADWKQKHRDYARREAKMAVEGRANGNKRLYYRLPPYLRAFAYFAWRYFLRLGFLDGLPGWRWHFWQGLWYRLLVDREISRQRGV